MAKHLAELRAFPIFLYGQTYMLGVEAWLAAPLFAIFGVSATLLKLPLFAMNLVIAIVLIGPLLVLLFRLDTKGELEPLTDADTQAARAPGDNL